MLIKVIVIAENANGEADFWPCRVDCTDEQYNNGDHFDAAEEACEDRGYENAFAADEHEPLFREFRMVYWEQVPVIPVK